MPTVEIELLPRLEDCSTAAFWQIVSDEAFVFPAGMAAYDDADDYVGPNANQDVAQRIPRRFYGVDVNRAAYRHDIMYSIGGNELYRKDADETFKLEMYAAIGKAKKYWVARLLPRSRARKYYAAVRLSGYRCITPPPYMNYHPSQSR